MNAGEWDINHDPSFFRGARCVRLGRTSDSPSPDPSAGSKLEPLKIKMITGNNAGEELDFVAARDGKPTVYVFIQAEKWDRPVARFLKTLDQDLGMDRQDVAI